MRWLRKAWESSGAPRWRALAALMGAALGAGSLLRAETVLVVPTPLGADATIKLAMPTAQPPRFGFAPVRVTIENSAAQDRTWQFQFQAGVRGLYPGVSGYERSITVPAGQTRDQWIYVPVAESGTPGGAPTLSIMPFIGSAAVPVTTAAPTPTATVAKIPNGMKIERSWTLPGSGRVYRREEIVIDEKTGEMTTTAPSIGILGSTGTSGPSTTRTSQPPPNTSVTYYVDPTSGNVTSKYSGLPPGSSAAPQHTIVVGAPAASTTTASFAFVPAPSTPAISGVKIEPLPNGSKVTRTVGTGPTAFTEVREINAQTGVITTVITSPTGTVSTRTSTGPRPGTETTFTINSNDGAISTNTRVTSSSTAAPKISVVTTAAIPSSTAPSSITSATSRVATARSSRMMATAYNGPPMTLTVDVSGPTITGSSRVNFSALGATANMRPIAAAQSVERVLRESLNREGISTPNLAVVDPATLPADWRLWSGFAYVYIPLDDYTTLDAARRAALRGWVALGGQLILVPADAGPKATERIGAGSIVTLAKPLKEAPTAAEWSELGMSLAGTTGHPDTDSLTVKTNSLLGTAVAEKEPDTSWLTVFLLLFAAVVGPVNLFLFAPSRKRHRLFFTTPLISLVAAIILGVTIFVQDGSGGTGLRRALVVLIPGDNQAAVIQEQSSRTGFISNQAFPVAADTQLTVLPLEENSMGRIGNFNSNPTMQRDEASASGSWFGSRGRQAFLLQRLVPTRGRVERVGTGSGGAPIVQSSLATPLRDFVLADERGNLWTTRELVPGKRTELERGGTWIGTFPLGGTTRFSQMLSVSAPKEAGRWGGKGDDGELAPFATHAAIVWQKSDVIYTGVLEGAVADSGGAKP